MEYAYGQPLKLKSDIQLKFYVDGIYPAGQLGYTEPHYKILFDDASLIIAESLAKNLFSVIQPEKINIRVDTPKVLESVNPLQVPELKKLNKDDLIAIAAPLDSSKDLTKLKKNELIQMIEDKKATQH